MPKTEFSSFSFFYRRNEAQTGNIRYAFCVKLMYNTVVITKTYRLHKGVEKGGGGVGGKSTDFFDGITWFLGNGGGGQSSLLEYKRGV